MKLLAGIRRVQRRMAHMGKDVIPDHTMARPPNSAAVYRSVQDWKPSSHKIAHSDGSSLEYEDSISLMHMILIDAFGFRWPVRFKLVPGMTLWDIFNEADPRWFGVRPTFPRDTKQYNAMENTHLWVTSQRPCAYYHPSVFRCNNCAVVVPYEYLDAMAPPMEKELNWLAKKSRNFTRLPSNARVACQVLIEDWMDGMTIAVPQTESLAYQMYYNHGTDKDTIDSRQGFSHSRVRNWDAAYMFPIRPTPGSGKDYLGSVRTSTDDVLDSGVTNSPDQVTSTSGNSGFSLTECFWKDNVDDVIRTKYPEWKGVYEFANK